MLTVYQLIQRINTEYPNNGFAYDSEITPNSEIDKAFFDYINSALNKIDSCIYFEDIYEFPTIEGQCLYDLPVGCELGNITEVTRSYSPNLAIRLRWARDSELFEGHRYYNGYGNTIGIFPTPMRNGEKITIFFKKTPMKVNTKDDAIEIKDRWIDLLVYAVIIDMASSGSNPDIEISNNYTLKYNNLLTQALRESMSNQPYYPKIKDNKRPPISVFRRGWRC